MSRQHMKLSIGIVIIIAAVGYLMFSGASENTMYFLTVAEIQHRLPTLQGEPVRVAGKVTGDPVHWDVGQLSLAFVMGEGEARIPVQYTGIKPDLFQTGADVIVEGYIRADGVLMAKNLMTSCPSKYQEETSSTS